MEDEGQKNRTCMSPAMDRDLGETRARGNALLPCLAAGTKLSCHPLPRLG